MIKVWVALALLVHLGVHGTTTYRAAVVEYSPVYELHAVNRSSAVAVMNANMDQYASYIHQAAQQGAQIILFPEDGLYGAYFTSRDMILPYLEPIPDVGSQPEPIVPCQWNQTQCDKSPILCRASCLARDSSITVVLNMGEVRWCEKDNESDCPTDHRFQYNTLVAFSSQGELVAKYHKSHLYYEPQFDAPTTPDHVWFESDFGVRFGLVICFDLMFEQPQLGLYAREGIRDFLWSSWWVNEPPLITGTQVELARSMSLPSNFLASGIGLSWYNSGSGIYSYGTPLQHFYNPSTLPVSKLLIADLPRWDHSQFHVPLFTGSFAWAPSNISSPTIETFSIVAGETRQIVSRSGDLLCHGEIHANAKSPEGELFGVYSLHGTYNGLFPVQTCALLRCLDEACTSPILHTSSLFDSFSLRAEWVGDALFMSYPMVAGDEAVIALPSTYSTDTLRFPSVIQSTTSEPFDLLNAALFGLEWHRYLPPATDEVI